MGHAYSMKAGNWTMADKEPVLSLQSLLQFVTIAVIIVGCAVRIENRFTTLEVQPLTEKQKAAIREEVRGFLQELYKVDTEEVVEPKKPATPNKPKPKAKQKITGQLGPLRATDPMPTYANTEIPSTENSRYFDWRQTN